MTEYVSIKDEVLKKIEVNLPEIRERFGIDTIGIFGSVARGEDSPNSDIDVLYTFQDGKTPGMIKYMDTIEYLENLFGRKIDFVSIEYMKPYLRPYVEPDMILFKNTSAWAKV